jgi:sarcosine oxidase gamma subunit
MKTTPFTEKHIALGAKMHEFAGYNMPIEYSGIIDEHITVCQGVGVFDVSHMGEFWVKGPQALAFLQKITSNNVAALAPGKIQYTCFPNEDGGIVDDLLVYQYEPEKYMLVVNASNMEKDWNWCVSHNTEGAELENSSDNIAQLAIQGPKAISVLQKLTDIDLATIPYYTFKVGTFASEENVIISNTGYTGAGGFELYFYPSAADSIWKAIFEAGEEYGIKFTPEQEKRFILSSTFGVPIRSMQKYLDLPEDQRDKILKNEGIPCDSVDNQFKSWVRNARAANADLRIAIKADATTPYSVIKNVMNSLQDLRENRYNLITSLKAESEN